MKTRTDIQGNEIGNGKIHRPYTVEDFSDYPQLCSFVTESLSSESVYVRYFNSENLSTAIVRFSWHVNNATRFCDEIVGGSLNVREEILCALGLASKTWVADTKLTVTNRAVKASKVNDFETADLTIDEMLSLGKGADVSMYRGKIAKNSNILILGNEVREVEMIRGHYEYKLN